MYIRAMSRPKNVILIVADSLRYDSAYHSPNDRLRYTNQNAIQFTQARSSGCWTLPATASLFTGLLPHEHGATSQTRGVRPEVPMLAERLKEAGYNTYQMTANVATTEIFGLDRGFDRVYKIWDFIAPKFKTAYKLLLMLGKPRVRKLLFSKDAVAHQLSEDLRVSNCWVQNTYKNIFRRSMRLLRRAEARGESTFLFLNLMETHFPYHVGPTFRLSAEAWQDRLRELAGLYHLLNQSFLKGEREYIKPRILQILKRRQFRSWKLLSRGLDRFIRRLHQDRDNLVIFASDHGDNFGEQGWVYHFSNVTDAGNRVPLMWLGADHHGPGVIDRPVSSRFVHNSILDACGLPHSGGTLFSEEPFTLPVLESFWYNNQGKTLPRYKYNQIAFVEEGERYLLRNGDWLSAPRQEAFEEETAFAPLVEQADPLEEMVADRERKDYLRKAVAGFRQFASTIPF